MIGPIAVHDRVAALILAAGASTRFGSPKQVAQLGGRTMLEAAAQIAHRAGLDPVLAVVPSWLAVPPDVVPVPNDQPALGLSHSLRLGIEAMPPEVGAVVVLLGDQPTLEPASVRRVIEARGEWPIVAAVADGLAGPPVLIERRAFDVVQSLGGDTGLREVIRRSPDVHLVAVDVHPPDVDTPADLDALAGR